MSDEKPGRRFANVPASVILDPYLEPTEKVALAAILLFLGDNDECWPSLDTLGAILKRSAHQAGRVMDSLVKQGQINKVRGGRGHPNRYSLASHGLPSVADQGVDDLPPMASQEPTDMPPTAHQGPDDLPPMAGQDPLTCHPCSTNNNRTTTRTTTDSSVPRLVLLGFEEALASKLIEAYGKDRVALVLDCLPDNVDNPAGWVNRALKMNWLVRARRTSLDSGRGGESVSAAFPAVGKAFGT